MASPSPISIKQSENANMSPAPSLILTQMLETLR